MINHSFHAYYTAITMYIILIDMTYGFETPTFYLKEFRDWRRINFAAAASLQVINSVRAAPQGR